MDGRRESYWLFVLVGGPIAGMLTGLIFSLTFAVTEQRDLWRFLATGGFFYTAVMVVIFSGYFALLFWTVRRETTIADAAAARECITHTAAKLKFRTITQSEGYYRFQPRSGLVKALCSQVEVWITPATMIVVGPVWHVKQFLKKFRPAGT